MFLMDMTALRREEEYVDKTAIATVVSEREGK